MGIPIVAYTTLLAAGPRACPVVKPFRKPNTANADADATAAPDSYLLS